METVLTGLCPSSVQKARNGPDSSVISPMPHLGANYVLAPISSLSAPSNSVQTELIAPPNLCSQSPPPPRQRPELSSSPHTLLLRGPQTHSLCAPPHPPTLAVSTVVISCLTEDTFLTGVLTNLSSPPQARILSEAEGDRSLLALKPPGAPPLPMTSSQTPNLGSWALQDWASACLSSQPPFVYPHKTRPFLFPSDQEQPK